MQTQTVVMYHAQAREWWIFENPRQIITVTQLSEVLPALHEMEDLVNTEAWYAAGFIAYEAAPAFDHALHVKSASTFPLLWFGLFEMPKKSKTLPFGSGEYHLAGWEPTVAQNEYNTAIASIKRHIAEGKTYQVNFTFRMLSQFSGSPEALFVDMVKAQEANYAAYVDTGLQVVSSASPELFFQLNGEKILCKPMKGTVKRGRTLEEDKAQSAWLKSSEKNRAENVMIVDMIRNDLGSIARVGSVNVPLLFETEKYRTLWQMTSTVGAQTNRSFVDIVRALFPCASITGAPKVSTMKIIEELESSPRGIYTGSIGFLGPGRQAQFNVAIRTVCLDRGTNRTVYGVGGGVVWDSTSENEFDEALLKAQVITHKHPDFNIFETLHWTPGEGYFLLERHLQRLADSAEYFRFAFDHEAVLAYLKNISQQFPSSSQRVHLDLYPDGKLSHKASSLNLQDKPFRVALSNKPTNSQNVYLFHKTTYRPEYEEAMRTPGRDDVLFMNERGELTEFTIGNLVLKIDGEMYTPPIDCGLLAGTFRAELLAQGGIKERILTRNDLRNSSEVFLINSVRGWVKVNLVTT